MNAETPTLGRVAGLGPLAAWSVDGAPLELGPVRQQAVLAVLALRANTSVAPRTLLDWVWGEHAPRSAEQVVHTYMYRLRRLLEPTAGRGRYQVLVRDAHGYGLRLRADRFDVTEFELAAEQALRVDPTEDPQTVSDALRPDWRSTGQIPRPDPPLRPRAGSSARFVRPRMTRLQAPGLPVRSPGGTSTHHRAWQESFRWKSESSPASWA